jgi:hypothetical protein
MKALAFVILIRGTPEDASTQVMPGPERPGSTFTKTWWWYGKKPTKAIPIPLSFGTKAESHMQ